jgi:ATP-dependent Clp protease ATP-binding subunit ClpA
MRPEMLVRIDSIPFKSFKEKEHIMQTLKKKFDQVKFTFTDNLVIYQYYEKSF